MDHRSRAVRVLARSSLSQFVTTISCASAPPVPSRTITNRAPSGEMVIVRVNRGGAPSRYDPSNSVRRAVTVNLEPVVTVALTVRCPL